MRRHVFFLLLAVTLHANAGSRGYTAILVDVGNQDFFETKTYVARRDGEFESTPQWKDCWQHRATGLERFGMIIRKRLPEGITSELASAIWSGDQSAMRKAQKLMKASRATDGTEIDGMYILKSDVGVVSMMALGARPHVGAKNPSPKLSTPWSDADPAKSAADLDLALCKVSRPLDFGFNP